MIGVALGLLSCSPFKGEVTCNDVRDVEYHWQVELLDVSGDVVPEEAWARDYYGIVTYTEKGAFRWQWLSEKLGETPVMSQPAWPPRGEREKPVVYSPWEGDTICYLKAPVSLVSSTLISYSGDKRIEDGELVVDPGYERVYEITLRARGPIDDVECVDQSVDVEWVLRLEIDEEGLNPVRGSCHHD